MPQYRVKPGKRHGMGKRYGPGDVVELTEQEAAGFLDKLERVVDDAPPAPEQDDAPLEAEDKEIEIVVADFSSVDGISDEIQQALYDAGYLTWDDVLMAGAVKVKDDVSGVGLARARKLFERAQLEG